MNKHFKKHLEASYTRAFEECARTGHKIGNLDAIFNSVAMATFAELIVQECITVAANKESVWPFAYLDFVELLTNHFKDNDES